MDLPLERTKYIVITCSSSQSMQILRTPNVQLHQQHGLFALHSRWPVILLIYVIGYSDDQEPLRCSPAKGSKGR